MNMQAKISRRTVLRGLGTAVALPWLEAMVPGRALAAGSSVAPRRMAFLYVPNGVHMPDWRPQKEGRGYDLPKILESLKPHQEYVSVLSGLTHNNARALGDGPGDHARSVACFLTGAHPRKTSGADIHAGVSVDQVAALQVGKNTRLPSLELGIDRGAQSGNCDSGYSCAYSSNMSWRSPSTPMAKEVNPRLVFDRLFGGGTSKEQLAQQARRNEYRESILDFAREDASRLKRELGTNDQRKLDEYFEGVRELEKRIEAAREAADAPKLKPSIERPSGVPREYEEHARLMFDLLALAFQTDQTRIISFMYGNAGSNRSYRNIGVSEGHHSLSHHGNNKDKQARISKINTFHMGLFAELLERLKGMKEGEGAVLDNSMIVYGSAISDGNRHNHDDLPVLLAGRGGGTIDSGRHIKYPDETPLMNLYAAMMDRMGVQVDELGDSTGSLKGLEG